MRNDCLSCTRRKWLFQFMARGWLVHSINTYKLTINRHNTTTRATGRCVAAKWVVFKRNKQTLHSYSASSCSLKVPTDYKLNTRPFLSHVSHNMHTARITATAYLLLACVCCMARIKLSLSRMSGTVDYLNSGILNAALVVFVYTICGHKYVQQ